jgi:hypothetical protein
MKRSYLKVTYRKGKPLAAYYYLPRQDGDRSARTEIVRGGLLVDYTADGRPIGIEITSPAQFDIRVLNETLANLGQEQVRPEDVSPLAAA